MGRSKFPGKPSKSVMKERIRVLYKNENGKSEKNVYSNTNKKNGVKVCSCNESSLEASSVNCKEHPLKEDKLNNYSDLDSKNSIKDPADKNDVASAGKNGVKHGSSFTLEQDLEKNAAPAEKCNSLNSTVCSTGHTKYSHTDLDKHVKKKTVTFKNVLETSDDTSVIKKIHNPLNKGPLVSIMKKECSTSQGYLTRGDGIVRPSRLTEIMKNNENIDKTRLLSFRSVHTSNKSSDSYENKKHDVPNVIQQPSSPREGSPQRMFLDNESEKNEFDIKNRNETDEIPKQHTNGDTYSQSVDKWKLHELHPKSHILETLAEHVGNECRKRSPKIKDSTLHNKIILRQPRLHFEPQNVIVSTGKQNNSSGIGNTNLQVTNLCTHSVCGVCNTTVSSKHIQNRKYGIIACDACRKFISKITKKTVSSSTNPLTPFKIQCSKRDGECIIPSIPKNNVKSFKKIYDERCSACWLKKCIKAFHFPSGHKLRLNAILSEANKNKIDVDSANKPYDPLPTLSSNAFKYGSKLLIDNDYANSQTNSMIWSVITTTGGLNENNGESASITNGTSPLLDRNLTLDLFSKAKQLTCGKPLSINGFCTGGKHTQLYSNSIFNKQSQSITCKSIELQSTNSIVTPEYPKRQKIDFKGPRVKHVCRSASIALGQQIATFSNDDDETSKSENSSFANSMLGNIYFSGNDQENFSQKMAEDSKELRKEFEESEQSSQPGFTPIAIDGKRQTSQNPFASSEKNQIATIKDKKPVLFEKAFDQEKNNCQLQKSAQKYSGNKNLFMLAHRNINSLSKRNLMRISKARHIEKKSKIISIDFWDNYIPAEVNQTGFGLILTEPVLICALCFLCGSMDLDYLLFCASCCEPYHSYCIEEENNSNYTLFQEKGIAGNIDNTNELLNQLNWVCPRCTVCYTCNMSSGAKIKCQKCKKNYHSTCMGTSKGSLGADRLICRNCLKCQTCSTTKVSKYVGNQPICMQCFKLKKSGIRCPLCNNFFDNILDLIILECGICEKLIHAKCEGLTEEQSNLLSNLQGYVKFVCKKCSLANDNAKTLAMEWRAAVYEELKAGLLEVLKLLSRSRQANVLKKNIKKNCLCGVDQINKNHHILSYDNYKSENPHIKEGFAGSNNHTLNSLAGPALHQQCLCSSGLFQQSKLNNSLSLFDIKKKIINGEYVSLFDFNADMNDVITPLQNDELILAYKEILSEQFSWFQNETKTCTDALEEDMFESCNYSFQLDEIVIEDQDTTSKLPNSAGKVLSSFKLETDNRVCLLCLKEGDGGVLQESRLLYYGHNVWVHANCAIWSNDVYEEFDGTLQNVHNALNRGRSMKCSLCKWPGATIKCFVKTCCSYYHFQCARKAECVFKSDKSVYCSIHCIEEKDNNSFTKETFTVFRPLYIEFDKSRRKYVEPSKVQFMVGSLSVIQLGKVYSPFSDTTEAIVPINFVCTRLYWSSREPWKIVKYSVRTLIQHSSATLPSDLGKNFTVDHSTNDNLVESGLSQIASWHNALTREENIDATLHYEYGQYGNIRFSTEDDNNNDSVSDACIEEEPQNHSDLFPPEIKDAIFEDLPHDILDGISMLDIFPKLMIYEDLITIDGKSDNMLITDGGENYALQISEDCPSLNSLNKQESNNKFSSNSLNHMVDTNTSTVRSICPKRELQRSNSEVFLRNFEGYRSQQRSSSVTWSCKFDNTRRYLAKGDLGFNSNYRKFENESDDFKTNSKTDSIFEDNKHLTPARKDKFKLMQLDGTDDTIMGYLNTHVQNTTTKSPVKCDRCHCTYRTFDSFQRHLVNCEQISTSESETETSNPDGSRPTILFHEDTIKNDLQLYHNQLASNQNSQANMTIISEPSVISSEQIIPQNIYLSNSAEYEDGFYVNIQNKNSAGSRHGSDDSSWQNISGVNSFNKNISKNKKGKCNYNFTNSNNRAKNDQQKVCAKTKSETVVTAENINPINNKTDYNSQGKNNYLQFLNQHLVLNNQYSQKEQQSQQQQYVVIQQSVGNNQPLFIQQVPNPTTMPQNIFPVMLSNNSIQYASIPTSTNQHQQLVQGPILQTDASGNVILSSGLQMLSMPSLQLTSQSSPQLVGTFNQPQALHFGSNQMLIGGTGTMELMPSANQVLLTAPPVYYGLETIVQNTVMSSQQFVSTAMQGVLSQNASFSATTTQVFQSSKFEPVSDAPSGYVVLNNADGTALVVPQTNLLSGFMNTNTAHDFHNNYTQDFGSMCGTNSQSYIQQPQSSSVLPLLPTLSDVTSNPLENPINRIQASVNIDGSSHIANQEKRTLKLASIVDNSVSSRNVGNTPNQNSILTTPMCEMKNNNLEEISMVTNSCGNDFNVRITCIDSEISEMQRKSAETSDFYSKNKVQAKKKISHKYIKRNRASKSDQMGSKLVYKNILQKEFKVNQPQEANPDTLINRSLIETDMHHKITEEDNEQYLSLLNTDHSKLNDSQFCLEVQRKGTSESALGLKDSTTNIVPRLNSRPVSQLYMMNSTKLPLTTASFGTNFNNVPTNIVAPILQTHQTSNTPSRPTNRVLPMQSTHKPVGTSKLKNISLKRHSFRENLNKPLECTSSDVEIKKKVLPTVQNIEKNDNDISIVDQKELEQNNAVVISKSNNQLPETKTNIIHCADGLNLFEKLPNVGNVLDLKKNADKSNDDSPSDLEKDDENNTNKDGSYDFPIGSSVNNDKVNNTEEKSVIENIEIYSDTQLRKPHEEALVPNECLEVAKSTETAKVDSKSKSKCVLYEQLSLPNLCHAISPFKKQLENEEIKKPFEPHLLYEIQSEDGFSYKSKSIADVWEKVFEAVQSARRAHGLTSLPIGPFADMCGVQMIGLKTNALKFLIEQLPGTERCTKYTPKYHKNISTNVGSECAQQDQDDLFENVYGAVRCEPFTKRSDYDLFSWLASRHRKQPKQIFVQPADTELIARRCTANLPMAMKYRTLKETCKHNVGVFRSLIHGRGLFCTKDIEAGEMVIEYAGELIRSTLTDKRERFYDSRGIGCYMFKIDDNFVVDATMRGNAARFINHSCEPNCYSKVVDILGHKHIIIFSLRRIVQGEELTYDYKFPFEDIKILCSCGSKKCRKYLN